jgi:hypothetical protein
VRWIAFGIVALGLFAVVDDVLRQDWMGWVYPNSDDLTVSRHVGTFRSYQDCRSAAFAALDNLAAASAPTFECGRGSAFNARYGVHVCAETRDD